MNLKIEPFHVPPFIIDNGEFILLINNNRIINILLHDLKNDDTKLNFATGVATGDLDEMAREVTQRLVHKLGR